MAMTNQTEPKLLPALVSDGQVLAHVNGCLGVITLNRAQARNALSLAMIRDITRLLHHWTRTPEVQAVLILGAGLEGKAPAFCAGGDIRFFHKAALSGDPTLEDFFTEEYELNYLIHSYTKPYIALMDGVVMGGGMGISKGAKLRVLSERSRLAMPETQIGLFPDVGGGWFLSQCPGRVGEWLALTGASIGAGDAIAFDLGDVFVPSCAWPDMLRALLHDPQTSAERVVATVMSHAELAPAADHSLALRASIDQHFAGATLGDICASLAAAPDDWSATTLATLRKHSPLMLAVTLEQVRRARSMNLAEDLHMERDLVYHCFHLRTGAASETVEGIRALVIDKDRQPRWNPPRIEDVSPAMVAAFFESPWTPQNHPLRDLK